MVSSCSGSWRAEGRIVDPRPAADHPELAVRRATGISLAVPHRRHPGPRTGSHSSIPLADSRAYWRSRSCSISFLNLSNSLFSVASRFLLNGELNLLWHPSWPSISQANEHPNSLPIAQALLAYVTPTDAFRSTPSPRIYTMLRWTHASLLPLSHCVSHACISEDDFACTGALKSTTAQSRPSAIDKRTSQAVIRAPPDRSEPKDVRCRPVNFSKKNSHIMYFLQTVRQYDLRLDRTRPIGM